MTANKIDLCLCSSVWVEKSLETNVREKKDSNLLLQTEMYDGTVVVHRMQRIEESVYSAVLWSLKDKASRIDRIVGEHRLFSQGLKELQDWVCEAQRVLNTCISTTTDKGVLEDRMLQLEVRRDNKVEGIFQRVGYWLKTMMSIVNFRLIKN